MSIGPTPPLRPASHPAPHPPPPQQSSPNQNSRDQAPLGPALASHSPRPSESSTSTPSRSKTHALPDGQNGDAGPAQSEQASADRQGDGRLAWQLELPTESDCRISDEELQQNHSDHEPRGRQLDLEG